MGITSQWYSQDLLSEWHFSSLSLPLRYHKSPKMRVQQVENVEIALEVMKEEGIHVVSISEWRTGSVDIEERRSDSQI